MGVMGRYQEEDYGHAEEPLASGGVLRALVDLLPESEVVIGPSVCVGLEGDAGDPVEHEE